MRILLVEDDESVAKVLQKLLSDERYTVDVAHDGFLGWQLASASHYDLVILDIVLPNLDGLAFCRRLRAQSYNMPVLLATALDSSDKKIDGLDAGADDYITKPFEPKELLARVRALLRRSKTSIALAFEWGELRLEPDSRNVVYGENKLGLTPKEYSLLELFLRNSAQVFSRRAILDNLWSYSEAPGEETVTSHIKGLRRKLTAAGAPADFVETVYGVGYRLKPLGEIAVVKGSEEKAIASRHQKTKVALATLWKSVKVHQVQRLSLLKKSLEQMKTSQLSYESRVSAYRATHSLIGVLGIFGFKAASELAIEVQDLLAGEEPIGLAAQTRLESLINQVETHLNQGVELSNSASGTSSIPLLVLVDSQLKLTPKMVSALWQKGLTVKIAPHVEALQKLLSASGSIQSDAPKAPDLKGILPDVVLLDFSLQAVDSEALKQLSDLIWQVPSLMVLICSEDGSLATRAKAAQIGSYPFLCSPSAADVMVGIEILRSHNQQTSSKILAVDDDPKVLAALRAHLEPQGFEIVTLNEPLDFWRSLQEATPDLLLLDISMPRFNGLELCQIVRQAPNWNHLPIVFFTSHTDAGMHTAALRAGANDLVEKSSTHSELSTHLCDQIKRSYLQQAIAAIADSPLLAS